MSHASSTPIGPLRHVNTIQHEVQRITFALNQPGLTAAERQELRAIRYALGWVMRRNATAPFEYHLAPAYAALLAERAGEVMAVASPVVPARSAPPARAAAVAPATRPVDASFIDRSQPPGSR